LIRHAESAGNVADAAAHEAGLPELDLALRDMDVPLSPLGEEQAACLGDWFVEQSQRHPDRPAPPVVICSPYKRAYDTATIALRTARFETDGILLDERLREREFGVLDRLTKLGIETRYPEQAVARAFIGKFFHRPPGGESWADVAARVRAVITDVRLDYGGEDVVIVTHQAVIMLFRYALERMTEAELMDVDRTEEIANTGVTTYTGDGRSLSLVCFNDSSHLPDRETTTAPDQPVAPR
jgi:broad specificity phosphatase PhoE